MDVTRSSSIEETIRGAQHAFAQITLPSTKCLIYTERTGGFVNNILHYLNLPNLTELNVEDFYGSLVSYQSPLARLMQACGPNLTWLEFRCSYHGDWERRYRWYSHLLHDVRHFKSLESLSLNIVVARSTVTRREADSPVIMDDIIRSLCGAFAVGWLDCPRLEELVLRVDIQANDVDADVVPTLLDQLKFFLRESCVWKGKEALEITIVMRGPREATEQLCRYWKNYSEKMEHNEESRYSAGLIIYTYGPVIYDWEALHVYERKGKE
ncbi:hypothetical protein AAF712_008087 [Marasmius tenuissimus]|uniref:Uncharacterized protein n=1 Tax=Marasmius tenuissimus TaxID=585030 RepID=A0ABR2ZUD5_9AGAR